MNLGGVVLNEVSQTPREILHDLTSCGSIEAESSTVGAGAGGGHIAAGKRTTESGGPMCRQCFRNSSLAVERASSPLSPAAL